MRGFIVPLGVGLGLVACADEIQPLATAEPGVVFTYPVDHQKDVPLGTRVVVTFSDPVATSALGPCAGTGASVTGAFCLVGPDGPVDAMAEVVGDGHSVQFAAPAFQPGTQYAVYVRSPVAPTATNLPTTGPLFTFTTRSARPRAAAPALLAVNGGDPTKADAFRPMFESSTIRLVFSEPLDTRTVKLGAGAVELIDKRSGTAVPATVIAQGIHVAIDPIDDLTAGATYELKLGGQIADVGGQPLAPATVSLTPRDTRGQTGSIKQVLRTRQPGDPGPEASRSGATPNVIAIDKPLIGKETMELQPAALVGELSDPKALDGPIAFTIRRGQRIRASGLSVKLGGVIETGCTTGDIEIEFLTDGGGRIYRNPNQAPSQRPENLRAPLYVDLSLDVAVYASDATGNAVLAQTVLGVQASGTVAVTDGVLAIETMTSMELGLLGVTTAPTNLVLELITDAKASPPTDTTAPTLVASYPGDGELAVDAGVELIFSEPVDLARLHAGGIALQTAAGAPVPFALESHGSAIVLRPLASLAYSTPYRVVMSDVADVAGNKLAGATTMPFSTPRLVGTNRPLTVVAVNPGVPCALTGGNASSPGHCAGGQNGDDLMHPFTLPANQAVEVAFSQPASAASLVRGAACGTGSVRIEELDASGTCTAAVAGTFIRRDRSFAFVPDAPWVVGKRYRLAMISGGDGDCDAGELCGFPSGDAASFDPLNGEGAGGPNLVIDFTGAAPDAATFMFADVWPYTDVNGSGTIETGEVRRDANRAALRIMGTSGAVSSARFNEPDCIPGTPEVEGCMYLLGAMPVALGEVTNDCPLPDGTSASSCLPVRLSPQSMYATSVSLSATVVISITSDTRTSVMRVREPPGGVLTGYIVGGGTQPELVVKLDVYLDAPDLSLPLGTDHDLHSKPLALTLRGAVDFLADGRIAIAATNTADVPVAVHIDAPLGVNGAVQMMLPRGEMKLQLVSRPLRGAPR